MAVKANRPQLVAVDANVLFDLADEVEDVLDSLSIIRERLPEARFILAPTPQEELANWALRSATPKKRRMAKKAIEIARAWHIMPVSLIAVSHGIAELI